MGSLAVFLTDKADRSVVNTPILLDLTNRVFDVSFATSLPGGFQSCTFSALLSSSQSLEWYERFLLFGIQVLEADEIVWEGRISSIRMTDFGITVECEGYWASMADQVLYSWWSDNDTGKWKIPAQGGGGISDEIFMWQTWPNEYVIQQHTNLMVFGPRRNQVNAINSKGVLYYRLPRVANLADNRVFQPMAIKSIQYSWSRVNVLSGLDDYALRIWDSTHPHGVTWTQRDSRITTDTPGVRNINLPTNGEAVAIGIEALTATTAARNDAESRFIVQDVTLYSIADGGTSPDTKADVILKHLFLGTGPVDNTHAKQISDDFSSVESSSLEVIPAIFERQTMQEIAVKLGSFGLDDVSARLRRVIVGVFGRRRFHFKKQDEVNYKWVISVREMNGGDFQFERTVQDFWTRVWGRFQDSFSGLAKFTEATNAVLEQSIYYDQKDLVEEFGEMLSETADKARDFLLLDSRKPIQRSEIALSGSIGTPFGSREPLWRVRAGDLIFIHDLVPFPVIRKDDALGIRIPDTLRLFSVQETEFNASDGTLSLVPDFPPSRLDLFLSQIQLTPSLSTPGNVATGGQSG